WNFSTALPSPTSRKFEFRGIAPGRYQLVANIPSITLPDQTMIIGRFGATPITVGSDNLDGIEITTQPLIEVQGRIVSVGTGTEGVKSVALVPADLRASLPNLDPGVSTGTPIITIRLPNGSIASSGAGSGFEWLYRLLRLAYQSTVDSAGSFMIPNVTPLKY